MPFTPFHMGPGIAVKAVLQSSFSLMVFGWTQILMDIQPLIVMITGLGHLHGFTHTYVGAIMIAVASAATGKFLGEFGLKLLQIKENGQISIPWWVCITSALIGSYSHVLLDSIMHSDVEPYFPFSSANGFLGILSVKALHQLCLYSGLVGGVLYFLIQYYRKWKL